ncbi:MAG: HAD family hydrolase, partial [Burkholderiales bacterium]
PYLRAAALHGIAASGCVAIEDSRWGIESARAAGMKCVGITHTYPAGELGMADAVIDSLDEFTADLIRTL